MPKIEPGVSEELAKWRAVQYSNISYKLNLTLEKMSPVLKGSIEIRVTQAAYACAEPNCPPLYIVLDWRKVPGHEKDSTISNVSLNGRAVSPGFSRRFDDASKLQPPPEGGTQSASFDERDDHLIFHDGVKMGENVIKLDFTSPILTSGSAITRYIDKEDGSEYIYSLFVPSDASTAFPCFDQPDLKARFVTTINAPNDWRLISNSEAAISIPVDDPNVKPSISFETKPISTYVFAFAAGPWKEFTDAGTEGGNLSGSEGAQRGTPPNLGTLPTGRVSASGGGQSRNIYVRASQAKKFEPHFNDVAKMRDDGIKYLETYFDYKFPFPKLDLVLIPEFPFGGMEHAGAIFLRETSVIFPAEPTKGDYLTRANLIFHEEAHQWFGDTVTMRWFDDLWLKEGFAEFMAYKTLEKVMPDANAWKVFYERNKQAAYATDSTRGTTPIYQKIDNLSAAKSAYGNIVYRKAPSFLRQAEFYLGEDKFQTAVRAFLKKHEFGNAGWEDLVGEFEAASAKDLKDWASTWVKQKGMPLFRIGEIDYYSAHGEVPKRATTSYSIVQRKSVSESPLDDGSLWREKIRVLILHSNKTKDVEELSLSPSTRATANYFRSGVFETADDAEFILPNYQDYGYGIFLLDDKSRDYVLKHIASERDPFLRSMMWGALWDSVREAELDPRQYVELAINNLPTESDETTAASIIGRAATALNYYVSDVGRNPNGSEGAQRGTSSTSRTLPTGRVSASSADLRTRFEDVLLDRLQHASTAGQRITFYRAYVANASTPKALEVLKQMLARSSVSSQATEGGNPSGSEGAQRGTVPTSRTLPTGRVFSPEKAGLNAKAAASAPTLPLRTKDKFDIVTRLIILGDAEAPQLLADLEKTETSDDAKRYAYAAHAAFGTAENKAKFFNDFLSNKDVSESWIESAAVPFNSITQAGLTQPYLARALQELPNLKRTRKIFFINNWLSAWIGGQRDQKALDIINKFLTDNPNLDNDLRLKVLENMDLIERAVKIRSKYP